MNPKIAEILEYIRLNEYFKAMKDPEAFISAVYATYPNRDILAEFKKANLWLTGNPKRQKKDYRRFMVNWLTNAFTKTRRF